MKTMTPEEEYAAKLVGTAMGAAIVFFLILVVVFIYKATDQDGHERVHPATEWQRR